MLRIFKTEFTLDRNRGDFDEFFSNYLKVWRGMHLFIFNHIMKEIHIYRQKCEIWKSDRKIGQALGLINNYVGKFEVTRKIPNT